MAMSVNLMAEQTAANGDARLPPLPARVRRGAAAFRTPFGDDLCGVGAGHGELEVEDRRPVRDVRRVDAGVLLEQALVVGVMPRAEDDRLVLVAGD